MVFGLFKSTGELGYNQFTLVSIYGTFCGEANLVLCGPVLHTKKLDIRKIIQSEIGNMFVIVSHT